MAIKFITNLSNADYVYSDLHLDISPDVTNVNPNTRQKLIDKNDIKLNYDEGAIRNSLRNLFYTRTGEVILEPTYGLPLYKYIGEPITNNTAESIGNELNRAIVAWEPRVDVKKIYVIPQPEQNAYHVVVDMEIPKLKKTLTVGGNIFSDSMQLNLMNL